MDRTPEFSLALEAGAEKLRLPQAEIQKLKSARLMRPVRPHSEFVQAAVSCAKHIEEVSEFLAINRKDYLQPGRSSSSQKDKIEEEACSKQISLLQDRVSSLKDPRRRPRASGQAIAHQQGVVLILTERLAGVTGEFEGLRKARSRQAAAQNEARRKNNSNNNAVSSAGGGAFPGYEARQPPAAAEAMGTLLPPDKMAMLQAENSALVQELSSRSQQVFSVEKTMQDISALNSLFSEQVLTQAAQVEQLFQEAVEASERVEKGNESLSKAIKLNSSTRMCIILVYCIAILGLLFLDRFSSRFGPV